MNESGLQQVACCIEPVPTGAITPCVEGYAGIRKRMHRVIVKLGAQCPEQVATSASALGARKKPGSQSQ
jgi:hypothetical protein